MLEVILSLCIALASLQSAIDIKEAKNTTINQTVVKQEKQVVKIKTIKSSSYKWETYTITAYRNGKESTGKSKGDKGYGVTASGAITREGITISADTDILPMGTRVYIEGVGERVVQDTGSAIKGHRIDLFMESYSDCMNFGKQKLRVRIIK